VVVRLFCGGCGGGGGGGGEAWRCRHHHARLIDAMFADERCRYLALFSNRLTGTIPSTLANLVALR
jgi:hypothetical protein